MKVDASFKVLLNNLRNKSLDFARAIKNFGHRQVTYSPVAAIFQGLAIIGCEILWLMATPPGIAVAGLAVAAVIMAFRVTEKRFTRTEQIIWIVLASGLFYIEIHSINTDRAESLAHEEQIRSEERAKFEAVLLQGKQINQKQKEDGDDQRQKFNNLLEQGKRATNELRGVATSVTEAQSYASGGTSYPIIFPYQATIKDGTERVGFSFQKLGKFPLFDVQIIVGRPYLVAEEGHQTQTFGTVRRFSELNGTTSYPLLFASMKGEDFAIYSANISARNGAWEEVIEVRRVGTKLVSRWVEYKAEKYGVMPLAKVLDLADQSFPAEFRHRDIYPLSKVELPGIAERERVIPDVIVPPR